MKRPRVLLADDHTLVVDGLRKTLEPECEVVGAVEDGRSLLAAAEKLVPDIILVDISMPLLNGVDAARKLRDTVPSAKVIFVTMHADATYVTGAFPAGASGYVLKRCASMELLTAIREVLKGRAYVTPLIRKDILGELPGWPLGSGDASGELTDRQREVVQLVARPSRQRDCGDPKNLQENGSIPQVERDAKIGYPQHCRIDEVRFGPRNYGILTELGRDGPGRLPSSARQISSTNIRYRA